MATSNNRQPPITFHGLLYIDRDDRPVNLSGRADPLDIYARCAAACARSVAAQGFAFALITNDAAALKARYVALAIAAPTIVEHRLALDVPPIAFRSAHHKLELFRAFASGAFGPAPALIDIDALLLRPLPLARVEPASLYAYDITAQVAPGYASGALARDLRTVAGFDVAERWWGGEFILGDVAAFAALANAVDACWPRYLAAHASLRHHGDEMVTSAALGLLARAGRPIIDLGGGVQRWWSNRTAAPPAATLRQALGAALLHLPADKPFLALYADQDRAIDGFANAYRRHVRVRWPVHKLFALAAGLSGRSRRFAPRLR